MAKRTLPVPADPDLTPEPVSDRPHLVLVADLTRAVDTIAAIEIVGNVHDIPTLEATLGLLATGEANRETVAIVEDRLALLRREAAATAYESLKTESRRLPVPLTETERLACADRVVELREAINLATLELERVKANVKSTVTLAEQDISVEMKKIKDRAETRDVPCEHRYAGTVVTIVRLDTGEEVGTRTLTEDERQKSLFGKGDGGDPDDAGWADRDDDLDGTRG